MKRFRCLQCNSRLKFATKHAGKWTTCPKCNCSLRLPLGNDAALREYLNAMKAKGIPLTLSERNSATSPVADRDLAEYLELLRTRKVCTVSTDSFRTNEQDYDGQRAVTRRQTRTVHDDEASTSAETPIEIRDPRIQVRASIGRMSLGLIGMGVGTAWFFGGLNEGRIFYGMPLVALLGLFVFVSGLGGRRKPEQITEGNETTSRLSGFLIVLSVLIAIAIPFNFLGCGEASNEGKNWEQQTSHIMNDAPSQGVNRPHQEVPKVQLTTAEKAAVDAEIQRLQSKTIDDRRAAIIALGEMGTKATLAIPVLAKALSDDEMLILPHAADTLALIGPGAQAAVPDLIEALKRSRMNQRNVTNALYAIGIDSMERAVDSLITTLADQSGGFDLRHTCCVGLQCLIMHSREIHGTVKSDDQRFKPKVVRYLTSGRDDLSPKAKDNAVLAIARVLKHIEDGNEATNGFALTAFSVLGELRSDANAAVPLLIGLVKSKNTGFREQACFVLGRIGPKARPAIPALRAAAMDREKSVREEAASALKEIDS